jgi:hypothetical protein
LSAQKDLLFFLDYETIFLLTLLILRCRPAQCSHPKIRDWNKSHRFERWTNLFDATDTFWRPISKDNITTWFGKTAESRVADPADPTRIFSWLICQSYDDKGNVIAYQYKSEDSSAIDLTQVNERNRTTITRSANRWWEEVLFRRRESTSRLANGAFFTSPETLA